MAILRTRETWKAPRKRPPRPSDLTPEEVANVSAAIRVLRARFGTARRLGEAMGVRVHVVKAATTRRPVVSAGRALRAARAAGVPLEDVLAGRWPKPGTCPHCGRGDAMT